MSRRHPKRTKIIKVKCDLNKYAIVDNDTGVVIGYECHTFDRQFIASKIEESVVDVNGCINGDDVAGLKDEPDFIDLLFDDRYTDPYS